MAVLLVLVAIGGVLFLALRTKSRQEAGLIAVPNKVQSIAVGPSMKDVIRALALVQTVFRAAGSTNEVGTAFADAHPEIVEWLAGMPEKQQSLFHALLAGARTGAISQPRDTSTAVVETTPAVPATPAAPVEVAPFDADRLAEMTSANKVMVVEENMPKGGTRTSVLFVTRKGAFTVPLVPVPQVSFVALTKVVNLGN